MSLDVLGSVAAGNDLSQTEMSSAIDEIMRGEWPDPQIALLLTALHHKGETVEEVAGAADAMRRHMTPIRTRHAALLDTCGTGGDSSGTFNISTAAALRDGGHRRARRQTRQPQQQAVKPVRRTSWPSWE